MTTRRMRHTAEIVTYDGWWYRYQVRRLAGFFIPERSTTYHRTLKGAQRAATRWRARDNTEPMIVETRR